MNREFRGTLTPHLPYLRRYAFALTGQKGQADERIREMLRGLDAAAALEMGDLSPRIWLYRRFHRVLGTRLDADTHKRIDIGRGTLLEKIRGIDRAAFLLTAVEGLSDNEAEEVLEVTHHELQSTLLRVGLQIHNELRTKVLIIEDEPVIADDLRHIVEGLGHQVIGIASTRREAQDLSGRGSLGLLLADIQLADGSSGLDAAYDLTRRQAVPVIYVTAFPERVLSDRRVQPTYLITKPFQPATLAAAITQILFFAPGPRFNDKERSPRGQDDPFFPVPSLVSVDVIEDVLDVVDVPAPISKAMAAVGVLQKEALTDVRHLLNRNTGHNSPGLRRRLESLEEVLAHRLQADAVPTFAIRSRALSAMLPTLAAVVDDDYFADLDAFSGTLTRLTEQLQAWRLFLPSIANTSPLSKATHAELGAVTDAIASQPDEVVSPELKALLAEARDAVEESGSREVEQVWQTLLDNSLKAFGRYFRDRATGSASEFNRAVDKAVGVGAFVVFIGGLAATLGRLYAVDPERYAFVPQLIEMTKAVGKSLGIF